jgi:hypothetical protein
MLETTHTGSLIRMTVNPCSESQFYTVYWLEVYGIELPEQPAVTAESLQKFVDDQAFSL